MNSIDIRVPITILTILVGALAVCVGLLYKDLRETQEAVGKMGIIVISKLIKQGDIKAYVGNHNDSDSIHKVDADHDDDISDIISKLFGEKDKEDD